MSRLSLEDSVDADDSPVDKGNDWWTVPNAICVFRLIAAPGLIALAVADLSIAFLGLYVLLAFSDWLDGKLAILLQQRSKIGPKLDTVSDVTMYVCTLVGLIWLKHEFLRSQIVWIVAALVSYALTVGISLAKFRQLPSYHTRAAKTSWLAVLIAVVLMMFDGPEWPFRLAAGMVVLTNLETAAMSSVLKHRQTDVPTIYHAIKRDAA
jgi:CDP-diacylglycerol--glycerol-3-phosphate 3-phosphatidyltransferase